MKFFNFYVISIFFLCKSLPSLAAASKGQSVSEPTGTISFENPNVDFGTLKRGQKITAKFVFKNSGRGPLIIQGVRQVGHSRAAH